METLSNAQEKQILTNSDWCVERLRSIDELGIRRGEGEVKR